MNERAEFYRAVVRLAQDRADHWWLRRIVPMTDEPVTTDDTIGVDAREREVAAP